LERIFPKALVKRYAFDVELLSNAHSLGYKIVEAPIRISGQRVYEGHVDLAAVWRMFYDTLGIFYRMRIRGYYNGVAQKDSQDQEAAVLGSESGSLVAKGFLAARGIETCIIALPYTYPIANSIEEARLADIRVTFVCVDDGNEESVQGTMHELDPYLEVLALILNKSERYKCFAFTGSMPPGMTKGRIVPYLESQTTKRLQEDFDIVVLPSLGKVDKVLTESRQAQRLVIGSTSVKGLNALSRFLKELEPVMLRTEPTIAEAVQHIRKTMRSNTLPRIDEILETYNLTDLDAERVIRAASHGPIIGPFSGPSTVEGKHHFVPNK
jgi:hypothetical protein